ncbi:MAG: hypothetical protein AAGE86_10715 [Pseudomonadota bacterium]
MNIAVRAVQHQPASRQRAALNKAQFRRLTRETGVIAPTDSTRPIDQSVVNENELDNLVAPYYGRFDYGRSRDLLEAERAKRISVHGSAGEAIEEFLKIKEALAQLSGVEKL